MKRRHSLLVLIAISAVLSSCGKAANTSTAQATPFIPFPGHDTPITAATGVQQEVWTAYQVGSIPAAGTPAHVPAAPKVVNATNGAVPDDEAQKWGEAFFRDAGWRKWAIAHAESTFLTHVDGPADETFMMGGGLTANVPDCAIWPTALTLIAVIPDYSGHVGGSDQYAFMATYTPPPTEKCSVNFNHADGTLSEFSSFDKPTTWLDQGWLHKDPLLGDIWITDRRNGCGYTCPIGATATPGPPPPFPDDDTLYADATRAQQTVWTSYSVSYIPRKGVLFNIPKAPKVDNQTHGVIPDAVAQQWAQDVFQQETWAKWAMEKAQSGFQAHIGDLSAFDYGITGAARKGGLPALPSCATYPKAMILSIMSPEQRAPQQASRADQFVFDMQFSDPCNVTLSFPDGTSQDVTTAKEQVSYGSVREDPFLGEIWYPDAVVST